MLLVTGSAGHRGEALVRSLRADGRAVRGLDRRSSPFTDVVGSEADDDPAACANYADSNLKTNEYLHRRVDVEDIVQAHSLALERAADAGLGPFIISATTPFLPADVDRIREDVPLRHDFQSAIARKGKFSALAEQIGAKGYHQ